MLKDGILVNEFSTLKNERKTSGPKSKEAAARRFESIATVRQTMLKNDINNQK
jgi:hypothetical protein